jgi:transglutaminase-like putative cysteine protease
MPASGHSRNVLRCEAVTPLTVRHVTTYRYAAPVSFGRHRLMLRPRDSHELWLESAELAVSVPCSVGWMYDVFGNSVAFLDFTEEASSLSITSTLKIERYALPRPDFPIAAEAETYPFMHSADDRTDLGRLREHNYPDPRNVVTDWAKQFVVGEHRRTWDVLADMNSAIHAAFKYHARYEEGTQTPIETLERNSGTCRDFALLFMEGARSLGFGARFVTGYLYDPPPDGSPQGNGVQGAGATHAWAEIFLPGAGWVEFDPTNGLIAAENLIRVAVTRDPSQAVPISGSYVGTPDSYLGMDVEVTVQAGVGSVAATVAATAAVSAA